MVRSGELAGIRLEGPWLSGAHCGAHDPSLLRAPDPAEVTRLLDAGDGTVRNVTLRRARRRPRGGGRARPSRRHRGPRAQRRDATPWRRSLEPAPRSRPTCSTRCARSTTVSPGRCWRSSTSFANHDSAPLSSPASARGSPPHLATSPDARQHSHNKLPTQHRQRKTARSTHLRQGSDTLHNYNQPDQPSQPHHRRHTPNSNIDHYTAHQEEQGSVQSAPFQLHGTNPPRPAPLPTAS